MVFHAESSDMSREEILVEKKEKSFSHELQYDFNNKELFRLLCGVADRGVGSLERALGVRVIPRGHALLIQADSSEKALFARKFFDKLSDRFEDNPEYLTELSDSQGLFRRLKDELREKESGAPSSPGRARESGVSADTGDSQKSGESRDSRESGDTRESGEDALKEKILTTYQGRSLFPRTPRQAAYVSSILNNVVTLCMGPAGTGKTFLAVAAACRLMQDGRAERLILTRPAVEAGESLGYLPGDLAQKVDPYLRPIYDALYECLGFDKTNELIQARKIEIAPLAFMRGRTLNYSAIILDEAQNCTLAQLKMFLTRLGKQSHMCIGGDVTQIDLTPGKSGFVRAIELLQDIESVGVVRFGLRDIIRNPLVERIVAAFEDEVSRDE